MNKLTPARVLDVMLMRTLLILALMAGSASAQDLPFDPPGAQDGMVPVSILFDRTHARPGEKIMMAVFFEIPEGLHIYPDYPQEFTNPTVITPAEHEWLTFGEPVWPEAYQATGGNFEGIYFHEGLVYVGIPVTVAEDARPGEIEVSIGIFYQGCTNSVCYNAQEPTVRDTLRIDTEASDPANPEVFATIAEYTSQEPPPPVKQTAADIARQDYESRGFLGLLALGVIGGLISLLMPCVWPLIPVTLMYFVKQGADSRARAFSLSGTYALGIVLSFTGIGFLFTVLLGADGARAFAADPWVNIAVGAIFALFAVSMFGVFEIRLPSSVANALGAGQQRKGLGGAFLLGILFSVVTFTCTIPISATILALATSADLRAPAVVAMFVYSATMAAPFLLFGLLPKWLKKIPRSGGWMNTVKLSVAFVEVGLALYYFSKSDAVWELGVLSRPVMFVAWIVVLFATALYLFGAFRGLWAGRVGLARVATGVLFLAASTFMYHGMNGGYIGIFGALVPPYIDPNTHQVLDDALAEAKKENKLVFVEFTGVT